MSSDGYGARNVTVVTVTYGNRGHYLKQVLAAVQQEGVRRMVVVNNGATWDIGRSLREDFGDAVDVLDMSGNTGSAAGFGAGINRAMDSGAELIWLLDDDNRPLKGTLAILLAQYERLRARHAADKLAVLAFRPEHQADVAAGVARERINPRRSSFRGFHLLDIPYKLWRRTPWGRPRIAGTLPETLDLYVAPYSGLLFNCAVVEAIGLPRTDFVLYADDSEFTYRLTHSGGHILLVSGAPIEDLESSWNIKSRSSSSFGSLLGGAADFRVYYGIRNQAYFEAFCMPNDRWIFWLNRMVYLLMLYVLSRFTGRVSRYQLIVEAVRDGLAGRLGTHRRFPL